MNNGCIVTRAGAYDFEFKPKANGIKTCGVNGLAYDYKKKQFFKSKCDKFSKHSVAVRNIAH